MLACSSQAYGYPPPHAYPYGYPPPAPTRQGVLWHSGSEPRILISSAHARFGQVLPTPAAWSLTTSAAARAAAADDAAVDALNRLKLSISWMGKDEFSMPKAWEDAASGTGISILASVEFHLGSWQASQWQASHFYVREAPWSATLCVGSLNST